MVEGQRVEGTWRHVFIHNGLYYLADLIVYADGMVDCWGLVGFDEFRAKVASGWVATTLPQGVRASAHMLATWTVADPVMAITGEDLVAEVADEIEQLAGRPSASERCQAALAALLAEPSEERRVVLRRAYDAVPRHLRQFLGGMDDRDTLVQILMTSVGERRGGSGPVVVASDHERAMEWFAQMGPRVERAWSEEEARAERELPSGGGTIVPHAVHPRGWPDPPGIAGLQIEYPAPIEHDGRSYPSVHHAFWARSVSSTEDHDRIVAEPDPFRAYDLALAADQRPDWLSVQLAVMADLLRAKFAQHPELAVILYVTGDGPIQYELGGSRFWGSDGGTGRNWLGRLLELVRAELAA